MSGKVDSEIKTVPVAESFDVDDGEEQVQKQKGGTAADAQDMSRMGKQQQLKRNFRFISIVGFIMLLQSTWESMLL